MVNNHNKLLLYAHHILNALNRNNEYTTINFKIKIRNVF